MLRILRITFQSIVIFVQNDEHGTLDFSSFDDFFRTNDHRISLFLFEKRVYKFGSVKKLQIGHLFSHADVFDRDFELI